MDVVSFPWERITVTALLGAIVWGALVESWVSGRTHRRLLAERDATIARQAAELREARRERNRSLDVTEAVVKKRGQPDAHAHPLDA